METPGTLYVVAVPLGDPADLSCRARDVLARVDRIAAEDTRVTARLLAAVGVDDAPSIESHHDHNERQRSHKLVRRLLAGEDVALVSDAGTPLVSDPGYRLVCAAVEAGVRVVPLPGPCAAIAALSVAALPPDRFLFLGFLPRDGGGRRKALEARRYEAATVVLYEAPHRIVDLLADVAAVWGDRRVCVARSLTKEWEELIRGTASEVRAGFEAEDRVLGELTVIVEGYSGDPGAADAARVSALVEGLAGADVPVGVIRDVVAEVFGRSRREIYQAALAARED